MSTSILTSVQQERVTWLSKFADYLELTKPRILTMVLISMLLSGMIATPGMPDLSLLLHTMIGTAIVAASGSVWNQWLERNRDRRMLRTEQRPIPSGRISSGEAIWFGTLLIFAGMLYLSLTTNPITTIIAGLTWILYVWVYTPLKHKTSWNTFVGAIPGGLPILIGWVGVGGQINSVAIGLFLLLFLWQFPHFMAIAWLYRKQYEDGGFRMISNVDDSGQRSGQIAISFAVAVLIVSLFLVQSQVFSLVFWASVVLGSYQAICAYRFFLLRNEKTARKLLRASLVYLPVQLGLITLFYSPTI